MATRPKPHNATRTPSGAPITGIRPVQLGTAVVRNPAITAPAPPHRAEEEEGAEAEAEERRTVVGPSCGRGAGHVRVSAATPARTPWSASSTPCQSRQPT